MRMREMGNRNGGQMRYRCGNKALVDCFVNILLAHPFMGISHWDRRSKRGHSNGGARCVPIREVHG